MIHHLAPEGFDYEIEKREDGFAVIVARCSWHDLMIKSGFENFSEQTSEFIGKGEGREIGFEREERICWGEEEYACRDLEDRIKSIFSG